MSKLNDIQQTILQLEGGRYQNMMDCYLQRRFSYPNFTSLGSQTGTDKPTKGVPDAYVLTERGKYIFIMYGTVQVSPFGKIKQDIMDCLDEKKTQIPCVCVERIICCHTSSNITPSQNAELHSLFDDLVLIGISDLSLDLHQKYPDIAKEFLSVSIDTNQILDLTTFIAKNNAIEYATPLDIPLESREDDVSSILALLHTTSVVMLSGQTGIGKTRLALEVAQRFCQGTTYTISFVRSNGAPIYEDLTSYFMDGNSHFIVVDDANQLSELKYLFNICIDPALSNNIKVLMTVRDYAKEDIFKEAHTILTPSEYILKRLKNEDIIAILEKHLGIYNDLYQQQIVQISKGNVRIAIMAGQRAKEGSFEDIKNVAEVYQWFFKRILDNMDKDELFASMLVAFCEVVTFNLSDSAFAVADMFALSKEVFIDKCLNLHKKEIVNVFRNLAVRFDQQNLRDYLLYYMFVQARKVKLSDVIIRFFPGHVDHIVYALNTILQLFFSIETMRHIENEVFIAWKEIQKQSFDIQLKYIRTFAQPLGAEALVFVRDSIPLLEASQADFYNYEYSDKQPMTSTRCELLAILASFKHTEYYDDTISLMIQMLEHSSESPDDYYYQLKHELSPDANSHHDLYKAELALMNKLLFHYNSTYSVSVGYYLLYYAKCCLRFEYEDVEYNERFSITFKSFGYLVCAESFELRKKCFQVLDALFTEDKFKQKILEILYNFPVMRKDEMLPFLERDCLCFTEFCKKHLSPTDLNSCILMHKFKKTCVRYKISVQPVLESYKVNGQYMLLNTIQRDIYPNRISWEQARKIQAKQVKAKAANMDLPSFRAFFSEILKDTLHKSNEWDIQNGILLLFSSLEDTPSKYVEVVKLYLSCGTPFRIHGKRIVLKLIEFLGYTMARKILSDYDYVDKDIWLCQCDEEIPLDLVTENICFDFLSDRNLQSNTLLPLDTIIRIDNKYPGYLVKYAKAIIERFPSQPWVIASFLDNGHSLDPESCREILYRFDEQFECLKQAYTLAISGNHFDYEGNLLLAIINKDSRFIIELFSMRSSARENSNMFMHLWNADNYHQVIETTIEAANDQYLLFANPAAFLFKQQNSSDLTDKQDAWLKNYIARNYADVEKMRKIFSLLEDISDERRIALIVHLCKLTNCFEVFKAIPLFAYSYSWSGSEVPIIEKKIHYLSKLKDHLSLLPQMFEHKANLSSMIFSLESRKEEVLFKEFIDRRVGI